MAVLADGQALAESRMRDTCTVTVPGASSGSIDPVTGIESTTAPTVVYAGPCRLRGWSSQSADRHVAGDTVSVAVPTLSVPVSAPLLPVDSVAVITGVPAGDPAGHLRLGRRFRVVAPVIGTDVTAQRVTVEAVTS